MDALQIQSALTGLAGSTLLRFDVPYPEPRTGVIAALGFDCADVEIIRTDNGLQIQRSEPLKQQRGWARLHPGLRVHRTQVYQRTISGVEKVVIEFGATHTWAQLVIGLKEGCSLLFPW